jgi:hypothetical protein
MLEDIHDVHRSQDLYKQIITPTERNFEEETGNIPICHKHA